MKPILPTLFAFAATSIAPSQAAVLIDSATNNGSFETIDPHTAPITNGSGRRAGNNAAFTVANLSITNNGFGGVDGSQIGNPNPSAPNRGQDGDKVLLANDGVDMTVTFAAIPVTVSIGDTFDLSAFTGTNTVSGSIYSYSFTLRFDGNASNDISLGSGSNPNSTAGDQWYAVGDTGVASTVAATSVELIINLDNEGFAGPSDQIYIDNVTLTHNPVPEPSIAILGGLGLLGLLRRRR